MKKIIILFGLILLLMFSVQVFVFLKYEGFPGFDVVLEEAFSFKFSYDYEILNSEESTLIENIFFKRYGFYEIRLSQEEHERLIETITTGSGKWKPQPNDGFAKVATFKRWERLVPFDEYGLVTGANVRSDNYTVRLTYTRY